MKASSLEDATSTQSVGEVVYGFALGEPLELEVGLYVRYVIYGGHLFCEERHVINHPLPVQPIWLMVCRKVQDAAWLNDAPEHAEEGCADEAAGLPLVLRPWVWTEQMKPVD